ncbi:hypothetical protein IAQ67_10645 [Paenibacillus peoriae]|uniref:YokE-like PH domain-containing protein n=1 Tax=Paenibacillus peoriae TaxID=59893 RepID=A0A7H0YEC1_9BACL|nr:hypothetical protein IAQ67_10645 [Paenibacillus peoriae]
MWRDRVHNIVSVQPYYKAERIVTPLKQETVIHRRVLHLYTTKIVSAYREFSLNEVYDISFKSIGQGHGVLYLHTKQGVFPYTVESDPKDFMIEFKKIVEK